MQDVAAEQLRNAARLLLRCVGTENEQRWREECATQALAWAKYEDARLDAFSAYLRESLEDCDGAAPGVRVLRVEEPQSHKVRLCVWERGWRGSTKGEGMRDLTPADAGKVARALEAAAAGDRLVPNADVIAGELVPSSAGAERAAMVSVGGGAMASVRRPPATLPDDFHTFNRFGVGVQGDAVVVLGRVERKQLDKTACLELVAIVAVMARITREEFDAACSAIEQA